MGKWNTVGSGTAPHKYEWTVGVKGQPPGTGLIDRARELIWRDAGSSQHAIFSVRQSGIKTSSKHALKTI